MLSCTAHLQAGCLVVNAPTANTVAAAEHGIALMCAMSRYVPQADGKIKKGQWDRNLVGVSLVGKTLGIYGFGKVGSEVARRAKGLGMTVIASDPFASAEKAAAQGVELVTFDEAIKRSDFHSLHMPLTAGTKNMFGEAAFAKIKKGSRIINVARGGVIDEAALVKALDAKIILGAALDVFDQEPPNFESEFYCMPFGGGRAVWGRIMQWPALTCRQIPDKSHPPPPWFLHSQPPG
jgi:D-3-phosphoglycerate dehydrogenase